MQPTKPLTGPPAAPAVPYDTGKVKIGIFYVRRQPWSPSRDEYALQTALLSSQKVRGSLLSRIFRFFWRLA